MGLVNAHSIATLRDHSTHNEYGNRELISSVRDGFAVNAFGATYRLIFSFLGSNSGRNETFAG